MEDFEKQMQEINEEIEEIDRKIEEIAKKQLERKDGIPFGLFSIVDNVVKLELLMDVDLFREEELKKLEDIANSMQEILITIQKREENK